MLIVLTCSQCKKCDHLDIHFTFNCEIKFCSHCHHLESRNWDYYFCNSECMFKWFKENSIKTKGFPCKDCIDHKTGKPSGYWLGFKENGPCKMCNGDKRVKKVKNNFDYEN